MTETFDPAWLALREDADHRARSAELVDRLEGWWRARGASAVLDLGSGTGSNLRYLAPRLPGAQRWRLVDHDAELLARVQWQERQEWQDVDVVVRTVQGDLEDVALAEVGAAHLVTASALLDLVSERWLSEVTDECAAAGCAALFALTYDGTVEWAAGADAESAGSAGVGAAGVDAATVVAPGVDAVDALVRRAVNDHQRRDKGLGAALGPAAASTAEALFRARGYTTWLAPSPWRLGAADARLVLALIDGWAAAACEQSPADAEAVQAWAERRRATVARLDFALTVGHQDLLALPTGAAVVGG